MAFSSLTAEKIISRVRFHLLSRSAGVKIRYFPRNRAQSPPASFFAGLRTMLFVLMMKWRPGTAALLLAHALQVCWAFSPDKVCWALVRLWRIPALQCFSVGGQEWPPYFLRTRKKYLGRILLAVLAPRTELAVHHHQPEIGAQHVLIGYLRLVAAETDAIKPPA